jgi:hypothetical protein
VKYLIAGLGSIGRRQLCWTWNDVQSILVFFGVISLGQPVEESIEIDLCFAYDIIDGVLLNYNHRPTTQPIEILGPNGAGRWISLRPCNQC